MGKRMHVRDRRGAAVLRQRRSRHWALIVLALGLAVPVFGQSDYHRESLALSGAEWLEGALRGLSYSPSAGGVVLAPASLQSLWSVQFPNVLVTDVLIDATGRLYVTGSQRSGGRWEAWLAAVNRDGTLAWQTRPLTTSSPEWSHGLALAPYPGGGGVLVGYAGGSLWVSAFASSSRVLWEVRLPADERSLGQDVVVRDGVAYVAATYAHDEGSRGAVLCFDAIGTLLWEAEIQGSVELKGLVWHDSELIALWRRQDGWSVSGLSQRGTLDWTLHCPATFSPVALAVGARSPVIVGVQVSEHSFTPRASMLEVIPGQHLEPSPLYVGAGFVPRVATGRPAVFGVLGVEEARTKLVLLDAGLQQSLAEPFDWPHEAQAQALAGGAEGQWAAAGVVSTAGSASSRVDLLALRRDLRDGEYIGPTWTLAPQGLPQTLVVRAGGLDAGQVSVALEASHDGFQSVAGRLEWTIRAEAERIPLADLAWAPSIRIRLSISRTEIGSPVVREVRLEMVEAAAAESSGLTPRPIGPAEQHPAAVGAEPNLPPAVSGSEPADPTSPALLATAKPSVGQMGVTAFSFSLPSDMSPEAGWVWDFGDGATGSSDPGVHVYSQPGQYTVRSVSSRGEVQSEVKVVVYRCVTTEFSLPFQFPGSRVATGDFDGDGLTDLAVWSEGSAGVHLYAGREGGPPSFRGTAELPHPATWVRGTDLDGDGFDDLLFGLAPGGSEIGHLAGGPAFMLSPARTMTVPLQVAHPVSARPAWPGILVIGADESGRRAVVWMRSEDGQFRSAFHAIPGGNATMVSVNLEPGRAFQQVFFGPSATWIVPDAPRPLSASLVSAQVLGAGYLDGDTHPDALVRTATEVAIWQPATGSLTTVAPWVQHDTWLVGDIGGVGSDQVIRIASSGSVEVYFLSTFSGVVTFSLPFAPIEARVARPGSGDSEAILVMSSNGQAAWVSLRTR